MKIEGSATRRDIQEILSSMDSNDATLKQYLNQRRNQKDLNHSINTRPISQDGVPERERKADPTALYDQAGSNFLRLKRNPPHIIIEAK